MSLGHQPSIIIRHHFLSVQKFVPGCSLLHRQTSRDLTSQMLVSEQFSEDCPMLLVHGVGCHWWFNYPGPLLNVELEFACLSG